MIYLGLLLVGVTAGLRAATALAVVSIGAWLGWIDLSGTWAAFAGHIVTVIVLVLVALGELVLDQLPQTPSRKEVRSIASRVVAGGLAGLVLGLPSGDWLIGLVIGVAGALGGTFGGYEARRALATQFGRDRPAALIEDVIAIAIAVLAVWLA